MSNKTEPVNSNSPTTDKTVENLQLMLDQLSERAAEVENRIRNASGEAENQLKLKADATQQQAKELTRNVEEYVHEHPMQALGIAFVGGLLLSSWFKR